MTTTSLKRRAKQTSLRRFFKKSNDELSIKMKRCSCSLTESRQHRSVSHIARLLLLSPPTSKRDGKKTNTHLLPVRALRGD